MSRKPSVIIQETHAPVLKEDILIQEDMPPPACANMLQGQCLKRSFSQNDLQEQERKAKIQKTEVGISPKSD